MGQQLIPSSTSALKHNAIPAFRHRLGWRSAHLPNLPGKKASSSENWANMLLHGGYKVS
jgi:hypothetical protein